MSKQILNTFFCLLLACFAFSTTHAQQVFKTTPTSVIGYLEYLPQDYSANSDKYPVVIFLHGIGERGNDSTDPAVIGEKIQIVAKNGPPMYVKNGTQFPFILISPQLKSNYGTWPSSYVMEVINYVKTYLRIDERRIYLTGLSLGGGGVWVAAQDYPELFAAIAPVCGGYNSPSKACGLAADNLPVWAFHGDQDGTVPMSKSVNMVNAINACTPAPSPLAKITIYPGVGHSAWVNAYKTDNSIHNPNVYQWIMSFTNISAKGNKIPVANAGIDKDVPIPGVAILNGTASDADGTISSYSWTQISGPTTATLVNNLTSILTASSLAIGDYVFRLTVKDNSGNSDSDYIKITVSTNASPVANAGVDKNITLPVNSVSVSGTGSDADGTISSYAWSKVSGSTATLAGTSSATLAVSNMLSGSYTFRLTVTDNKGASTSDDMNVTVAVGSASNVSPVANAGSDKSIILPVNSVDIIGSGTDADGSVKSYKWSKISGPSCYMYGVSKATLQLSSMFAGSFTFRLTVTDDKGATGYDDVSVIVQAAGSPPPAPADPTGNVAPVANAGSDRTLTLPSNSVNLTGGGTDSDGSIWYYKWTKVSGPSCYMYGVSKSTLEVSSMVIGSFVFRLTVTDNKGATHSDEVSVIVKDAVTSATSFSAEPAQERISSMQEPSSLADELMASNDERNSALGNMTTAQLENSTVFIFNDSGEKIYSGEWTRESYSQVMNKKGLYIYNIIKDGKRTGMGRIYIRD